MNNLYSSWPVVYILSYLIFSPLLSPSFSVSLIFEDYNCTYVWLLDVAWWVYSIHCLKIFCFLFCSSGRIISVALCPSSRSSLASPLNLLRPCEGYLISFRILYFLILEYLLAFLMAYIPQRFSICCFFFFFLWQYFPLSPSIFVIAALKVWFSTFNFSIWVTSDLVTTDHLFSYPMVLYSF